MTLPTKKKIPPSKISDYILFIVGDKKVGKTSFCCQFPDHFILEFECGNARHLEANYEDVTSLRVFDNFLKELEANPGYCKTLILDEITILYNMIWQALLKTEGIEDPAELSHGKGWGRIGKKFDSYINRICALKCGIIFTGHSEMKEVELRSGRKIAKLEAAIGGRTNKTMDRITHLWGVMQFAEDRSRQLYIVGSEAIKAGHGFDKRHFKNVKEGYIDLGNSPEEGYKNFIDAWNNGGTPPSKLQFKSLKRKLKKVVKNNG